MLSCISARTRDSSNAPPDIIPDSCRDLASFSRYNDRQGSRSNAIKDFINHYRRYHRRRNTVKHCVDIAEFAVNKLIDRGSLGSRGIVTNVQDFIANVAKGLKVL